MLLRGHLGVHCLSERLARRGPIGAGELTEVLDHVLSRMLEVAYGNDEAGRPQPVFTRNSTAWLTDARLR